VPQLYTRTHEGVTVAVKSKSSLTLVSGDSFTVQMPGGGGYGPPKERDVDLVARDVQMGYISVERARDRYGVAIIDGRIDVEETLQLRSLSGHGKETVS
jgi:N-methylhydantoinase B